MLEDLFNNKVWLTAIALNTVLGIIALALPRRALTTAGIIHAWGLGILLWGGLGWQGFAVMVCYFILGTAVTYVGRDIKEARGIAEKRSGARGPENLWGSAAVGAMCAVGYLIKPNPLWLLGYTASISAKLADTCASEIGKAYGKHTYLITNLQAVPPGTEGAVSIEGTLAGVVGALLIALVGWSTQLIDSWDIPICVIAAFVANTLESLIGATLQNRYSWLTNELVNGINTLTGASIAVAIQAVGEQIGHTLS
jgi:uncharacterized protein (TIGR00297 family)